LPVCLNILIVKMKVKNLPPIVLIFISVFCAACGSLTKTHQNSMDMPDIKIEKNNTGNEVVFDDAATENKGGQVATFNKQTKKETRTTPDGKINVVQDKAGNTFEVRYFNNHPNLSQIVITTRPDGTKEVVAIGHNRENKRIPPDKSDQALTLTGTQIATLAGIHSVKQTRSNRSMDGKGPKPPANPNPSYQYPTPAQPQTTQIQNQTQPPGDSNNQPVSQNN
jgi:hypothetical protein